eukprot:s1447_g7.t1
MFALLVLVQYHGKHVLFLHHEAIQTSSSENLLDTKFDVLRTLKSLELKSLQTDSKLSVELYTGQASVNHRRAKIRLIGNQQGLDLPQHGCSMLFLALRS